MLKPPNIIVLLAIAPFTSVRICFVYLNAPVLNAYMLTSVTSSSCIDIFIIYNVLRKAYSLSKAHSPVVNMAPEAKKNPEFQDKEDKDL